MATEYKYEHLHGHDPEENIRRRIRQWLRRLDPNWP